MVMLDAMTILQVGAYEMTGKWFDKKGNVYATLTYPTISKRSSIHGLGIQLNGDVRLASLFDDVQKMHPWVRAILLIEKLWRDHLDILTLHYLRVWFCLD